MNIDNAFLRNTAKKEKKVKKKIDKPERVQWLRAQLNNNYLRKKVGVSVLCLEENNVVKFKKFLVWF